MSHLDRDYFKRRADEERARANAQPGTTAAIFYHKLADAYERRAGTGAIIASGSIQIGA